MSTEAIVFSDVHFGDPRSLLHNSRHLDKLLEIARQHRPIRRVILLGDILDLQIGNWSLAIEGIPEGAAGRRSVGFRRFLNELVREVGARQVHYVPGNHDYRVFDYLSVDRYLTRRLATGKRLRGKLSFYRHFRKPFLRGILVNDDVVFEVTYPHLELRLGGHRLVLGHGHYLDASQGLGVDARRAFSKVDPKNPKAVANARQNFFRRVGLYQSIVDGGAVNYQVRQGVYRRAVGAVHALTKLNELTQGKARGRPIDRGLKQNILSYTRFCCRGRKVDGFIFGHTHRAGEATVARSRERPLGVWNCGTFLQEKGAKGRAGSFLLLYSKKGAPLSELVRTMWLG
jgi:UDP-2,3-diacylglucosamine pyrophosphatase LpxH